MILIAHKVRFQARSQRPLLARSDLKVRNIREPLDPRRFLRDVTRAMPLGAVHNCKQL